MRVFFYFTNNKNKIKNLLLDASRVDTALCVPCILRR
jgi:hypothetical protein